MGNDKPTRKNVLRLNLKRKKLLEGVRRGLNISEAGRVAGYGTAQSSHRAMNLIRLHMPDVLDKIGLPAEKLLKELAKQLNATKKLYFSHQGMVRDMREVPDHEIQLRALIELAKMWDLYPRTNRRKTEDASDRCSEPIFKLVISSPKPSSAATRQLAGHSLDHDHPGTDASLGPERDSNEL
jgi:hypothetical protein